MRPAETDMSDAVRKQKQELRRLEGLLEIDNLDLDEVLFRFPIHGSNLTVRNNPSRGLGELSIELGPDERAVHKQTGILVDDESLFLTKGDYMGTRRYWRCSDRQLMFWWHWYVLGRMICLCCSHKSIKLM